MKNLTRVFILVLLLTSTITSKAQFADLFNKAKDMLKNTVDETSKKLMNEAVDYVGNQTEKILRVSGKSKISNSSRNSSQSSTTSNYSADKNSVIPLDETEKFIRQNYPNFYTIYKDLSNDPLVNEIVFVMKETHNGMCFTTPKGKIIYDLYYFEDLSKPKHEDMKCWSLLLMQGVLHNANSGLTGVDAQYKIYDFALHQARNYADKGNCFALKRVFDFWAKDKVFGNGKNQQDKQQARAKLIQTDYYKNCEEYFNSNSSCRF